MKRTIALLFVTAATVATVAVTGGSASAAHCNDDGGPGNSHFAEHVQAASHKEGGTHRGYSSCIEGNPNNPNS